jgi:hypothetical protein
MAVLIAGFLLASCAPSADSRGGDERGEGPEGSPRDLEQALDRISSDALRGHVEFLASDELQGRMTGTDAYDAAAAYVARQFEQLGLQPGGEDGWYQQVPFVSHRIDVDSATVTLHRDSGDTALEWKDDYVMGGDAKRPETSVRGDVVFAGYGVHAPELAYSDYDGIDVSGKIVALFGGAPPSFPHNERAYYSSSRTKAEEMAKRGAIGWIGLRSRVDQKRMSWERITLNAGLRPGMSWINLSGEAAGYRPELQGGAYLNEAAADRLFAGTPLSFDEALVAADAGTPRSTPLGIQVSLSRSTDHEQISSPNVIGILPGSDPDVAGEYVVFSAHLDHIGTGAAVDGDTIYNGAYDNAMGVSLLIETARILKSLPQAPARSILFIAVTGEERGLLGSDYFAHYPTVPTASLIANVNLDMPLFLYPLADVIAFGAEHSTLAPTIEAAVSGEGFALTPDPLPEEVLFIRSDQYSFVRQGIPAVYLVPGFRSRDPDIDGRERFMSHLQTHYHSPSDDLSRPVDWPSARRFARANVRIGFAIAADEARPRWNEGDFFGEKFQRSQKPPARSD